MRYFLYLFLAFVFYSCGYKTITTIKSNGDKIIYRKYKDSVKDKKYGRDGRCMTVYNLTPQNYLKFNGTSICDSSEGNVYIQYSDTSRIYIRLKGNEWDCDIKYLPLFTSGLLYPKLIQCAFDSLCRPLCDYFDTDVMDKHCVKGIFKYSQPKIGSRNDSMVIIDSIYTFSLPYYGRLGWQGNAIEFYKPIEIPFNKTSKTIRGFDFSILVEDGMGYVEHHFILILKNENGYKGEDWGSFCKGAKVIVIRYMYQTFWI